jgi:hypothetical protein
LIWNADLVTTETAKVADQVASNEQYAKNITSWIKDNLGANLEKMQQQIETTCEEKLAAHLEEIKAREESLWSIFQTKFDKMKDDVEMFIGRMDANYQKMQSQFLVLQEETKKGTAARMSMEQSHAVMKQTHDTSTCGIVLQCHSHCRSYRSSWHQRNLATVLT